MLASPWHEAQVGAQIHTAGEQQAWASHSALQERGSVGSLGLDKGNPGMQLLAPSGAHQNVQDAPALERLPGPTKMSETASNLRVSAVPTYLSPARLGRLHVPTRHGAPTWRHGAVCLPPNYAVSQGSCPRWPRPGTGGAGSQDAPRPGGTTELPAQCLSWQ